LRDIYNAADVLALASSREGWPNVLLEALACGTRCAASQAGGAEVIQKPEAGVLVEERTPKAFADAIGRLLNHPIDRIQTRHYAEAFSWAETADGVASVFSDLKHKTDATSSLRVAPIVQMSEFAPKLIVTVDTEEQFNWAQFDNIEHTVCAPSDIARFQSLCAEFAIQPLYFLSYPLLTDDKTVAYFRTLLDAGDAFGGLHLHQWATPPERGFAGEYYSFQKNLPPAVHAEKLAMLANAFEAAIGFPAIAHRAGRYGISPADYVLLAKSGVSLDFSPSAAFDFSPRGGPDFSGFSNQPFRAYGDDWSVCVTPVSGAHALKKTRRFRTTAIRDIGFAPPDTSPARKVLQPMRLSPEGADLQDLQALTQRLIADRTPVLTFTLHSTSLTPGANPYARAEADVDRLLQTCRDYFTWFRNNIRGDIIALPALADIYEQATQASA
ncbi:MAG: glycosyltransferase, partial [Hyphococcus sp.]